MKRINEEKLVVTGPGSLLCKKIIHVKSRRTGGKWKDSLTRCLEKVEALKFSSVSLPTLGTGKVWTAKVQVI